MVDYKAYNTMLPTENGTHGSNYINLEIAGYIPVPNQDQAQKNFSDMCLERYVQLTM